jgi:hypothetical protein
MDKQWKGAEHGLGNGERVASFGDHAVTWSWVLGLGVGMFVFSLNVT